MEKQKNLNFLRFIHLRICEQAKTSWEFEMANFTTT